MCYHTAGGLLPHRFTLTLHHSDCLQRNRNSSGGLVSVPLSVGSLRPGVTRRPALWSSDFPQTDATQAPPRDHPTHSPHHHYTRSPPESPATTTPGVNADCRRTLRIHCECTGNLFPPPRTSPPEPGVQAPPSLPGRSSRLISPPITPVSRIRTHPRRHRQIPADTQPPVAPPADLIRLVSTPQSLCPMAVRRLCPPPRADAHPSESSSTALILRASSPSEKGFCMKRSPSSRTPRCAMTFAV
jgi:hypothetical protein